MAKHKILRICSLEKQIKEIREKGHKEKIKNAFPHFRVLHGAPAPAPGAVGMGNSHSAVWDS